jgi:hypothetical protein
MVLLGKLEGKILLGRPRHGWEDNININILEKLGGWYELD